MTRPVHQKYLIDVRTPAEFTTGALPGANNVEYQSISQFLIDQRSAKKDAEITLYCRSGRRSAIAKAELDALGFSNVRDWGGIEAARAMFEEDKMESRDIEAGGKKQQEMTKMDKEKLEQSTSTLLRGLRELG
jgi:rhodanese-related sulfurtransferase